jgi:hypothetical protein
LFELPTDSAETVCANIDLFKKLNIVRSALNDQDVDKGHEKQICRLFSRIETINNQRVIAAHANFDANVSDGVVFNRVSAKTGLQRSSSTWTEKKCSEMFAEMEALRRELHTLAQTLAPYRPSADFSDPRNSMYIAAVF